jgi:hypothetical protein
METPTSPQPKWTPEQLARWTPEQLEKGQRFMHRIRQSQALFQKRAAQSPTSPQKLETKEMHPPNRATAAASDIHSLAGLTPRHDAQFSELLKRAISGNVPVYFAAVPLVLCVPFDLDYRPDLHSVGMSAISQMTDAWNNGNASKLVVYQRGKWFVVADDYIGLFAALSGLPDYVPCWVLGKPEGEHIRDVQGPIASAHVAGLLGMPQVAVPQI